MTEWLKLHYAEIGTIIVGFVFVSQGLRGIRTGEFWSPHPDPALAGTMRVKHKMAVWVGSFLILLGNGCFLLSYALYMGLVK
ncbi:MAG: hypothetical protein Q8R76_00405 [Candidatus Omnitrophota bacterium]|nr:hypothetical protein [Candidatus Omnitrophota bacterium]